MSVDSSSEEPEGTATHCYMKHDLKATISLIPSASWLLTEKEMKMKTRPCGRTSTPQLTFMKHKPHDI